MTHFLPKSNDKLKCSVSKFFISTPNFLSHKRQVIMNLPKSLFILLLLPATITIAAQEPINLHSTDAAHERGKILLIMGKLTAPPPQEQLTTSRV
jgi:hypothetical protein